MVCWSNQFWPPPSPSQQLNLPSCLFKRFVWTQHNPTNPSGIHLHRFKFTFRWPNLQNPQPKTRKTTQSMDENSCPQNSEAAKLACVSSRQELKARVRFRTNFSPKVCEHLPDSAFIFSATRWRMKAIAFLWNRLKLSHNNRQPSYQMS